MCHVGLLAIETSANSLIIYMHTVWQEKLPLANSLRCTQKNCVYTCVLVCAFAPEMACTCVRLVARQHGDRANTYCSKQYLCAQFFSCAARNSPPPALHTRTLQPFRCTQVHTCTRAQSHIHSHTRFCKHADIHTGSLVSSDTRI